MDRSRFVVPLIVMLAGCATSVVTPPVFDGPRAYDYLQAQVAFGPRVPGSQAWKLCREYYVAHFTELGCGVDLKEVQFMDPYSGEPKPLVNVIIHVKGKDDGALPLMFAAHWDSRPRCDASQNESHRSDSLPGANDGASGVAVLMELANGFAKKPPACNIDLVLLDGEDWGAQGDMDFYFLGARAWAAAGVRGKYQFGILLDMIGDADQQIFRESFSETYDKPLNDMVWGVAKKLGVATFKDSAKYSVEDDHLVLSAAGLPTIDLIDFDYPYWHTEEDTPDKCSPTALANVGQVLYQVAYDKSLWPAKP